MEELRDAVRAVLDAARAFVANEHDTNFSDLARAVDALEALAAKAREYEGPMAWGKCLAGDEALGADGRYHRILSVASVTGKLTYVDLEVQGQRKRYTKGSHLEVTIRRPLGPEGDALAVLEAAGLDVTTIMSGGV